MVFLPKKKEKTRPVLDQFQDCCNNWFLDPGFYGCKKGCYGYFVIQSSNQQKLKEEKNLVQM